MDTPRHVPPTKEVLHNLQATCETNEALIQYSERGIFSRDYNLARIVQTLAPRHTPTAAAAIMDILEVYVCCHQQELFLDDDDDDEEELPPPKRRHHEQQLPDPLPPRKHIKGQRRTRADLVRSVFTSPGNLRTCDNVVLECFAFHDDPYSVVRFKRYDMWSQWERQQHDPKAVIVAIEASHVCAMDVAIRRGLCDGPCPFILGSNFVGVVHHSDPNSGFKEGMRVAGLVKGGGNARYITISADELITVPKRLDASEVACVLSTYLPAFQALHHGCMRPQRYTRTCFRTSRILITDGARMEASAMIRLAQYAGAKEIYVICPRGQHEAVRQMHAIPLDLHVEDWLPMVEGKMDIVVDFQYSQNMRDTPLALAPGGRFVWYVHPNSNRVTDLGYSWGCDCMCWEQTSICTIEGSTMYDLYESWQYSPDEMKMDLAFLHGLLAHRQIRPKIERFITLSGIPKAHNDLQTRSMDGAIICEPWKIDGSSIISCDRKRGAFVP